MSPILFMAYYDVYIKELRLRHPSVLFLSYVDDLLFVTNSKEEVKSIWALVEEIGSTLGLRAHPDKTKLYHWGGEEVGRTFMWGEQLVKIKAPCFHYLGHYMAALHCKGNAMEDFKQQAVAELTRYGGRPPLDDWEKVQLLNIVIALRLMHKALLLGDEEYWYYMSIRLSRISLGGPMDRSKGK